MRRFVFAVDPSSPEEQLAFKNSLGEAVSWWHWVSTVWLIVDPNDTLNVDSLVDKSRLHYPGKDCFILQLNDDGTQRWSGLVSETARGMADEWLNGMWSQKH